MNDKSVSSVAPAEIVSIVKPEYVLGLLALNSAHDHGLSRDCRRASVEKTAVPSNAMSPLDAWSVKINAMDKDAPGDTAMFSRASSSASAFSTPSVADSVEFTETNPETLRGLGIGIDANDKEATDDTAMLSRASSSATVAESVGFIETNPEALRGLGLGIDTNDKEAPGDAVMNDAADESEMQDISTGADLAVPMQKVCLF